MGSFDARLYLDVNVFAERTVWAHWLMRAFAQYLGLLLLGCLVLAVLWRARGGAFARGERDRAPDALWTAIAAVVSFGLAIPIADLIGRSHPYSAIHSSVELLIAPAGGGGLPSALAAMVGAAIVGLWLTRDRTVAMVGGVVGLFLCFAQVYVGAQYPGDEVIGLALGAVVVVALRPVALPAISFAKHGLLALSPGRPHTHLADSPARIAQAPQPRAPSAHLEPVAAVQRAVGFRILEAGAKVVPHVTQPVTPGRTSQVQPAIAHVYKLPVAPKADAPADTLESGVPVTGT